MGEVEVRDHLGLSNHEMIEFSVHDEVRRGLCKTTTMDFQRADFGLLRMLVERVLKGKGFSFGCAERKLERQKPSSNSGWPLL